MTENPPASLAEQKEPKWTLKQIESMLDYVPEHVSFDTFSGQNTVDELRQLFRAHMPDGQPRDISEFPLAPSLAEGGEQKVNDIQSDYDLLIARVESGELGTGNLVAMILAEREQVNAARLEVKEWQVLFNDLRSQGRDQPRAKIDNLIELILWLAIPWADNDPLFPEGDGWTPRALAANVRMKATWQRVVRNTSGAVPEIEEEKEPHGTE
jgi:hypothetical protein